MDSVLSREQKRDFFKRGFSRRNFGRIAAMITAGAALPFYNEPALAQLSKVAAPPDAVKINANENPLGPCHEAARGDPQDRRQTAAATCTSETDKFQETARRAGRRSSPSYVTPYAGSSAPLHQAVLAFTSPRKPFVTADPGYEAGERAARVHRRQSHPRAADQDLRARREGHGRGQSRTPA